MPCLSNVSIFRSFFWEAKILWGCLDRRRKLQTFFLSFLIILASIMEVFSISAIFPFIVVLTDPEKILSIKLLQPCLGYLNITSESDLVVPVVVIFCFLMLFSGAIRILLAYKSTQLSFGIGADLSYEIYRRSLYRPYSIHISRNSGEIISAISMKIDGVMAQVITPSISIITSFILLAVIFIAILIAEPIAALSVLFGLSATYLFVIRITRRRIKENSLNISESSNQVITLLQESFGGIRDVIIDGSQQIFCEAYKNADSKLRESQANNQFVGVSPRYFIEAVGITLFAIVTAIFIMRSGSSALVLPMLASIAFGIQRMLPLSQQIYNAWVSFKGGKSIFEDVIDLLNQPAPKAIHSSAQSMKFARSIEFSAISYRYPSKSQLVLSEINLKIPKGSKIGIVGASGSGKSTFLDVLMGLLTPTMGHMKVDDEIIDSENMRCWQARISHVPQSFYLADKSIVENIAFGIPADKIDYALVKKVVKQANLDGYISSLETGLNTRVGERGSLLSGGQRQRIAIARALYKNADLIILDEATSSLDESTENSIMKTINALDKNITLIIVAHRLITLSSCEAVYEIVNGSMNLVSNFYSADAKGL